MKKALRAAALLLALALLSACGGASTPKPQKNYYEHGLELVSLMEEMTQSEAYTALYSASAELKTLISAAGTGDFSKPKAVYRLILSDDTLAGLAELVSLDSLSEPLRAYVKARAQAAIANQINARGGATTLAASSICAAGKTFVSAAPAGDAIYLYTYANAVPALVTFTAGEGGAVSAAGSLILYGDFPAGSRQALESFFAELGAKVEAVEVP